MRKESGNGERETGGELKWGEQTDINSACEKSPLLPSLVSFPSPTLLAPSHECRTIGVRCVFYSSCSEPEERGERPTPPGKTKAETTPEPERSAHWFFVSLHSLLSLSSVLRPSLLSLSPLSLSLSRCAFSFNSREEERGEELSQPSLHRGWSMASTGAAAAEGGTARETRNGARAFFDAESISADESETALLSTAGALSPRSVPPPPDEIVGPPRRVRVLVLNERETTVRERERGRKAFLSLDGFFPCLSHSSFLLLFPKTNANAAFPPERRAPVPLQAPPQQTGRRRRPERERRLWRQAERRQKRSFFFLSFDLFDLFFPRDQAPQTLLSELGPGSRARCSDSRDGTGFDARVAVPQGRAGLVAAALVSLLFLESFCFPRERERSSERR